MQLYKAAPILIFNFNRFKSHNVVFSEKMTERITFPVESLDMSQHFKSSNSEEPLIYDLHGVITHYGNLYQGHYIAYAKNSIT